MLEGTPKHISISARGGKIQNANSFLNRFWGKWKSQIARSTHATILKVSPSEIKHPIYGPEVFSCGVEEACVRRLQRARPIGWNHVWFHRTFLNTTQNLAKQFDWMKIVLWNTAVTKAKRNNGVTWHWEAWKVLSKGAKSSLFNSNLLD